MHDSSLSAELAHMGISSSAAEGRHDHANGAAYHANGQLSAGGTGISGAGRGRYGRQAVKGERRLLGTTNGYASSLSARSRGGNWKGDGTQTECSTTSGNPHESESFTDTPVSVSNEDGIISTAIANAAEQQPTTPQSGKENVSLLAPNAGTQTPTTKFTFTCESDSSNKMAWPSQAGGSPYTPISQNHNVAYPARGVPGAAAHAMAAQTLSLIHI